MSELFQKYDYPLLVFPASIRFFKYEISIHRKDNHLKDTIETQQSNTVSIFARSFQTDQIVIF